MKLDDLKTLLLLPEFMRADNANAAFAEAWDEIVRALMPRVRLLSQWKSIDSLLEDELDELAWELNIAWYLPGASIPEKRQIIKESDIVSATLGTKYAVEEVVKTYFGTGRVQEWFEYSGTPFHFRIYTSNPTVETSRQAEFLRILNIVKRKTAVLDEIIMGLVADMYLRAGFGYREVSREITKIGR
jgi:hypothetical protein